MSNSDFHSDPNDKKQQPASSLSWLSKGTPSESNIHESTDRGMLSSAGESSVGFQPLDSDVGMAPAAPPQPLSPKIPPSPPQNRPAKPASRPAPAGTPEIQPSPPQIQPSPPQVRPAPPQRQAPAPVAKPAPPKKPSGSGFFGGLSGIFGKGGASQPDSVDDGMTFGAPELASPQETGASSEPAAAPMAATSTAAPPAAAASAPAATAAPAEGGGQAMLVVLFATWASIATILAAWLWFTRPDPQGGLENLPDDGSLTNSGKIISPFESLSPDRQVFHLGETKRIGDLAITPLRIENRRVELTPDRLRTEPCLVLTLRVQNLSKSKTFYPTDPVFLYPDHKQQLGGNGFKAFKRRGYTYTFIQPNGNKDKLIFSYDLAYDFDQRFESNNIPRLGPDQTAELLVVSEEDAYQQIGNGESLWRIKIRKGKNASDRGVAAVIGIVFDKAQIKNDA